MVHDWQRHHLANNVTKVTGHLTVGWEEKIWHRHSISERIHVAERNRNDEGMRWLILWTK